MNSPEQLERSEHNNKVKWLHVEGKSNETKKGKHCHQEVKPEKVSKDKTKQFELEMPRQVISTF